MPRPAHLALVLVLALVAEMSAAAAVVAWRTESPSAAAEAPLVLPRDDPRLPRAPFVQPPPSHPAPAPPARAVAPKPAPPAPAPKPTLAPKPRVDTLAALRGFSTWVDLYDYGKPANDSPASLVAQAAAQHVSTIWVETSRYNTANIAYAAALGQLVDAAHARGITVIAWVLPEFRSVSADLAHAKAAAAYRSPGGHRFAALGIDIEVSSGAAPADRSARLVSLMKAVYGHVGMPVVAIVPPPVGFSRHPEYWPGFPWRSVAAHAHAIATMGYWSYSHDAPPDTYTTDVLRETRALVGRSSYPIHVIGGLAADTTPSGAAAFCRAAKAGHALGASLYDLTSTPAALWKPLQACRSVGH